MFPVRCIVAALALLTAPALADEPNAATPAPAKKICRSESATGSIMVRRICRTKSEWAEIDAQTAKSTDRSLEERSQRSSGNGGI
jgi:hypothetical protein